MWQPDPIGADVAAPETVQWLWPNYLPRGMLVSLDGDPECGKSMLTVDLAARLTRGGDWPDGAPGGPPGTAILFPAEDPRTRVVHPRLLAAGADPNRVFVYGTPDSTDRPTFPRDLGELAALIELLKPDLLVLDPLPYFVGGNVTMSVVGSVLAELAGLAARHDVTVLFVRHLAKKRGVKALYRGLGAIGIVGAARAGLLVARDPADAGRLVLTGLKSNPCPTPRAMAFRVVSGAGAAALEWLGPAEVTADEAARGTRKMDEAGVLVASEWLVRVLAHGEVPAAEVLRQAKAAGIAERTLERAKANLHVMSRQIRNGNERLWAWSLTDRRGNISQLTGLPKLNEDEEW